MKIKWVKKIERISDAGDVKESIYKPKNGKGDISVETVKKAIRLQSGSRWETNSIRIHKDRAVLKTNYDTFEKSMCSSRKDDELIMKMTAKEFLKNANAEMGRKVWEHYGEEAQTKKLVEELAELITAIAREDARAVREEMADVEVMIMQFKQGFNIDTLPIMNYKLNRTLARIENEKNK